MRTVLKLILIGVVFLGVTSCSKFKTYDGPEVTRVVILKSSRQMYLFHDETVLKAYDVDLGFAPEGHKQQEGDGRTPEGSYEVDRRNPGSSFHLSIGINYPNEDDIAAAKAAGIDPGSDIFIHGGPTLFRDRDRKDWTFGCISVSDKEMEDIYAMVKDGTVVDIFP